MERWPAKHDSGFHFHGFSVAQVGLESPLFQRVCDRFGLVGKCAEKMNVLHLAIFVDDDSYGNRVKVALGEDGVDARKHILVFRIILYADGKISSPVPAFGSASSGSFILFKSRIRFSSSFVFWLDIMICSA